MKIATPKQKKSNGPTFYIPFFDEQGEVKYLAIPYATLQKWHQKYNGKEITGNVGSPQVGYIQLDYQPAERGQKKQVINIPAEVLTQKLNTIRKNRTDGKGIKTAQEIFNAEKNDFVVTRSEAVRFQDTNTGYIRCQTQSIGKAKANFGESSAALVYKPQVALNGVLTDAPINPHDKNLAQRTVRNQTPLGIPLTGAELKHLNPDPTNRPILSQHPAPAPRPLPARPMPVQQAPVPTMHPYQIPPTTYSGMTYNYSYPVANSNFWCYTTTPYESWPSVSYGRVFSPQTPTFEPSFPRGGLFRGRFRR